MGFLARHCRSATVALLTAAILMALPFSALAQNTGHFELNEQKIKAGLVYNFLKYTSWPVSSGLEKNRSIRVCLLGGDSFDGYLSPLHGRTAQQYKIEIDSIPTPEEGRNCNMVFIHRSRIEDLPDILKSLESSGALTVSDIPRFAEKGGMIELSMQKDQRIHLFINGRAARNSGLVIQDRLLKLAETVR